MLKKVALSCALTSFVFGAEMMYSPVVKPVYLDINSKKVVAKLLPTNGIEILEKKDGMVKFSITGYQNPKISNVIYAANQKRILALAFSKTAKPNIEIIKKGENGNWNEVKTIAYTSSDNLVNNNEEILAKAKQEYEANCSMCHSLHSPKEFSANQWPSMFKAMLPRTPVTKEQSYAIIEYLQKNAK